MNNLPLLSDLEDQEDQLDVYLQPTNKSLGVLGPPGSGKTVLAVWRSVVSAKPEGSDVVLVTRNKLLAAVASDLVRQGQAQSQPQGQASAPTGTLRTLTMHKLVWRDYEKSIKQTLTEVDGEMNHDWTRINARYAQAHVLPHVDHLIVDEAQNLPFGFFRWAQTHVAKTISIFADEHQTIHAGGSTMAQLQQLNLPDWFRLMYNHRNTEEIARLSGWFHRNRKLPQATAKRGLSGDVPNLVKISDPAWGDLATIVSKRLSNVGGSIGVITYRREDVDAIQAVLKAAMPGKRVDGFHSKRPNGSEFIRMQDDGVTVLASASAIGLEFDTVYLHDVSRYMPVDSFMNSNMLYMLTARARDLLVLLDGPTKLNQPQLDSLPTLPYLVR
ncbi:MAG: AAA family ATPase [Pseudomonadota bacterium]|nr:AAA family ATPase [Pseudomonadota bacterium]